MAKKRNKKRTKKSYKSSIFFQKVVILSALILFLSILLIIDSIIKPRENKKISPNNHVFNKIVYPEVIKNGSRNKKEIAITFDADMTYAMINLLKSDKVSSWYNKPIIDYLVSNNIKATIFFTGLWVKTYPEAAKEIAKNSLFEVGNHSYSHPAFTKNCYGLPSIANNEDIKEIESAQREIVSVTGIKPLLFRFPGGCSDNFDLKTVSSLGLTTVYWDVVSGDAFDQNTQMIINTVDRRVQNGSIIVMHLNGGPYAPKTYFALQQIIPELQKRGFTFVKVSELLSEKTN